MKLKHLFYLLIILIPVFVIAEDWLQWGGPNGDFTIDTKNITDGWGKEGPKILWDRPLGDGYSSFLAKDNKLFTMYSEGDSEIVVSLFAETGETDWEHKYKREFWADMRPWFGPGPNATPIIVDNMIISVGIAGELRCLDIVTGELIWHRNITTDFGRKERVEEYGYSNSIIKYKNSIIVHVGGDDVNIVAINPKDGVTIWENKPGYRVSYGQSSILNLAGQDQFIYFTHEGVNGLDPKSGKLLWHWVIPISNGNHLTPVVQCDENHIFVTSQFSNGGGRLLKITDNGVKMQVEEIWFETKLRSSCWTHVRIGDYIYGSAGGHNKSHFSAFNWRTGKIKWRKKGCHMAQALYADEKFILLDKTGILHLAKVSPKKLQVLCSAQVTGEVSWTLPTLVGTKLYLRDRKKIVAIEL